MKVRRIIVLTGGGVAPGLNSILSGILYEAQEAGIEVWGSLQGWKGLIKKAPIVPLKFSKKELENLKYKGGTIIETSRTNPVYSPQTTENLKQVIKELNIDSIIAIGGNDTLGAAQKLYEDYELKIVGVPKTIDNDLNAVYFTIGFPTAATLLIEFTRNIVATAKATGKIYLIETLGGKAGWLCSSAFLGGAVMTIIPEKDLKLENLLERIRKTYQKLGWLVIAISDEALPFLKGVHQAQTDQYGLQRDYGKVFVLREIIEKQTGFSTKVAIPGNFLSGGKPIPLDVIQGYKLGQRAVKLVMEEDAKGIAPVPKNIQEIGIVPLKHLIEHYKSFPDHYYDENKMLPNEQAIEYFHSLHLE